MVYIEQKSVKLLVLNYVLRQLPRRLFTSSELNKDGNGMKCFSKSFQIKYVIIDGT